jgi:hypothetical protein
MTGDPSPLPLVAGSAGDTRAPRRWWLGLVLLVVAYFGALAGFPRLMFALGINHFDAWFVDTFAVLASNDAVTRGLDPYAANPLDYFQRPHVYSHWWLYLRQLGLTRADATWLGLGLALSYLAAAMWRLRPDGLRQLLWYAAVMCSSPVLLALERGNNDLVVFLLLLPLVPCLLSRRREVRLAAAVFVAVAAMLKYYPAAAFLVLLAAGDRQELRFRLLVGFLLMAVAGLSVAGDLAGFGPLAPRPAGLMSFGATGFFTELGWLGWAPKLLCAGAGVVAVAWAWSKRMLSDWEPAPAEQASWLYFVLGAVLLTGCFFTSMNFGYRWIFAVWLAPMLWTLARAAGTPAPVRRLARGTMALLLFALWWSPLCCVVINGLIGTVTGATIMRLAKWSFLLEQPFDWAFFLCLVVFLTHFARRRLAVLGGAPV